MYLDITLVIRRESHNLALYQKLWPKEYPKIYKIIFWFWSGCVPFYNSDRACYFSINIPDSWRRYLSWQVLGQYQWMILWREWWQKWSSISYAEFLYCVNDVITYPFKGFRIRGDAKYKEINRDILDSSYHWYNLTHLFWYNGQICIILD